MTRIERQSLRKKKAILYLLNSGECSVAYALLKVEELNDKGLLTENDYEELAEYLESLLEPKVSEETENIEENQD